MKLAIGAVPPLTFVLLRLAGSLALLAPVLLAAGQGLLPERGERLTLFWVGQLQVAGFLICSIIGLSIVPAGRAIVLAYTMPLWAIPIGRFLWPEPIGRSQITGAAIGFLGLVLFMNPSLIDWGDPRMVAGNGLLIGAAILWALGSCLYRQRNWRSPFWVQTFWQLTVSLVPVAAIVLVAGAGPGALVAGDRRDPRLQRRRHHRARLFSVEPGTVDDAGGDGGAGAYPHPGRRLRALDRDLRRRRDRGRRRQHRPDRRRDHRHLAALGRTRPEQLISRRGAARSQPPRVPIV